MNKKYFLLGVTLFIMTGVGYAEYATPGLGQTFDFLDLVGLATDEIQQDGPDYVLVDKITISAGDTLTLTDGELFTAAISISDSTVPVLVIQGTLQATDWAFRSLATLREEYPRVGILVDGLDNDGASEATFNNCTFEKYQISLAARGGGKAVLTGCTITDFIINGVMAYSDGEISVGDSSMTASPLVVDRQPCSAVYCSSSVAKADNCAMDAGNVFLLSSREGSLISGCNVSGVHGPGLLSSGDAKGRITGSRFEDCEYGGLMYDNATVRVVDSVLTGNLVAGLVVSGSAEPVLRRINVSQDSQGDPNSTAILTLDGAQPDLGTEGDYGLNKIRCTDGLLLYHAGTKDIQAIGNDWGVGEGDIETLIYHQPTDAEDADASEFLSGTVFYTPLWGFSSVESWGQYE